MFTGVLVFHSAVLLKRLTLGKVERLRCVITEHCNDVRSLACRDWRGLMSCFCSGACLVTTRGCAMVCDCDATPNPRGYDGWLRLRWVAG
jgi:hypothetical protein